MEKIHGTFHLPGRAGSKFGGELSRTDGEIVLEVVGWDSLANHHELIVGLLSDGRSVTLVDVRKSKMRVGVQGPRPRFRVWHMLIGRTYRRIEQVEFDRCSASFTDLSDWWFWGHTFTFVDGAGAEYRAPRGEQPIQMRYRRPSGIQAVLADMVVAVDPVESQHMDSRRYSIKTHARVTFRWSRRQSLQRMYSDLDAMESLLWTVLDQPSLTRSIVAVDERQRAKVFSGDSKVVQPVEIRTMLRTPRPRPQSHALFPRPDEIAPHFQGLCERWYHLWRTERDSLAAMAEADIGSHRSPMVTPPVRRAWYMAHARSLDAIWALGRSARAGKVKHLDVLSDVFASHGHALFPDQSKAPDWDALAFDLYSLRNDAGHGRVKARRRFNAREIMRGQNLTACLGRVLLLELAGIPDSVAVDWVTRGDRWASVVSGQGPAAGLQPSPETPSPA